MNATLFSTINWSIYFRNHKKDAFAYFFIHMIRILNAFPAKRDRSILQYILSKMTAARVYFRETNTTQFKPIGDEVYFPDFPKTRGLTVFRLYSYKVCPNDSKSDSNDDSAIE